ncbi:MAG: phosphatidate cytidylyltransferase [Bacteroidota bacterium]|jgi:phosphatidate cytidylyltransferase
MKQKSNIINRSLVGVVFVTVLVGSTIFGPVSFALLFAFIALGGLLEFYRMMKLIHISPNYFLGILTGFIIYLHFVIRAIFPTEQVFSDFSLWLALLSASFTLIYELFRKKENPISNISATLFGIIYTIVPFAFLIQIAHFKPFYEPRIILSLFFLIWTNDTFAYLSGSLFGKRKLMERISPGKTWEGFIGGGVFTLILAFFLNDVFPVDFHWHMSRTDWMVIGLFVFLFGTLGDLIESMMKRFTGVKDSGKILGGHGGILDRFDSLIFVVPFLYGYLFYFKANLPYLKGILGLE